MLGRADNGYNLLIGNPIYISYLLLMAMTSCVAIRLWCFHEVTIRHGIVNSDFLNGVWVFSSL